MVLVAFAPLSEARLPEKRANLEDNKAKKGREQVGVLRTLSGTLDPAVLEAVSF